MSLADTVNLRIDAGLPIDGREYRPGVFAVRADIIDHRIIVGSLSEEQTARLATIDTALDADIAARQRAAARTPC